MRACAKYPVIVSIFLLTLCLYAGKLHAQLNGEVDVVPEVSNGNSNPDKPDAVCGNGVVERSGGETCDSGSTPHELCKDCRLEVAVYPKTCISLAIQTCTQEIPSTGSSAHGCASCPSGLPDVTLDLECLQEKLDECYPPAHTEAPPATPTPLDHSAPPTQHHGAEQPLVEGNPSGTAILGPINFQGGGLGCQLVHAPMIRQNNIQWIWVVIFLGLLGRFGRAGASQKS